MPVFRRILYIIFVFVPCGGNTTTARSFLPRFVLLPSAIARTLEGMILVNGYTNIQSIASNFHNENTGIYFHQFCIEYAAYFLCIQCQ